MDERVVRSDGTFELRPLEEMKQPWRALIIIWMRRLLRGRIEGLVGIDRSGRPLWEPGYPKEPDAD